MKSIKQKLARKAVKSTAKHTAHGASAKLKRQPLRSATLLAAGCAAGVLGERHWGGRRGARLQQGS
jgi:ferric-dicitrate binding protein FerR (iron transport regulator)